MHPAYFTIRFRSPRPLGHLPAEFAVITAWPTTGEEWPGERIEAADRALEAELRATGRWMRRLTGYSPTTGHAEPGWAVGLEVAEACDLGARYRQDAIYVVREGKLFVTRCGADRGLVPVGDFMERLDGG